MIWGFLLLVIFLAWIIAYIKNKKAIVVLPYLFMLFITPIYNILDQKIFVEILGCGCVPSTQTNMFNIAFNANDLRRVVYIIMSLLMLILGIKISKKFTSKKARIIYNISIIIFNIVLTYFICMRYMWG